MSSPNTPAQGNRYYSAPPGGVHSAMMNYYWSDSAVQTGANQPVTGNWVSEIPYVDHFAILTSGATGFIPVGARSWTVNIVSGGVYLNGTGAIPAPVVVNGGSLSNGAAASGIVVSGAGNASFVFVQWEA